MWKKLFNNKASEKQMETLKELKEEVIENYQTSQIPSIFKIELPMYTCHQSPDVFNDIEMIESFNGDISNTVFSKINSSYLQGSSSFFKNTLTNPTSKAHILQERQHTIQAINGLANQLDIEFQIMKENEDAMMWMYTSHHERDDISSLYNMVYFNFILLKPLNYNSKAITCLNLHKIIISPLIGLLSPITYFIIPYLVLRVKFGVQTGFKEYLIKTLKLLTSGESLGFIGQMFPITKKLSFLYYAFTLIFYFQGIFNGVEVAKVVYNIASLLTKKMEKVASFVRSAEKVNGLIHSTIPSFATGSSFTQTPLTFANRNEFESWPVSPSTFMLWTDFGRHLKHFKHFDKESYIPLIKTMFVVDTLLCLGKLNTSRGFCYPTYDASANVPRVSCTGIWHPCLENVVKNDVEVEKSIIVTGPNAGGKSTMIKSILLSVLFAQTIGLANCDSLTMTPMLYIGSQMNIPDCKGKESLFEAEMYRSKANFDIVKSLALPETEKNFSILFMDEIFNSTNPVEGIAGAYAIAKNIAMYPKNLSLITTHFIYLTKLAKETDCFKNIKMNVIETTNTNNTIITYPYKISKGVSKQYIAIELLKQNGFNIKIIQDALDIKRRLIAPVSEKKTCRNN